ncbi:sugar transferase [Sphingomonas sp.]|jgi:O-antigen biosynthesis protein WbqP|uniref:sugar transferase n=1 Tax=Sphingomonas sp. TaxID=28214 RepID=UPI002DE43106|nr:sugar transferase [Sphingomonas sp.]
MGAYAKWGKRTLDVTLALTGLLLLLPFMAAIAIAIRLADPGPVIFRQLRTGRGGRTFEFYKFRSMPVNTGNVPSDQLAGVKLSPVGRFIRRTNLDELPQLINILRGDMSIVGPRPPIPSQTELIELRRRSGALACRPGLTGWAQVNSFDGMSVAEKATLDAAYATQVSLIRDLSIIARTFSYLLKPPPRY